jgi:Ca-activated chloride channel family protein
MSHIFLLLLALWTDPGDIGKVNAVKAEAKKAFQAGDYKTAAERYRFLVDSAGVQEDEVNMNLAHSYFNLNDTALAVGSYQRLTQSEDAQLRSLAYQQLGVLNNREGRFEEALQFLKQSLKANPANQDARYNYEMIRKKLEEQKKKQQQDQNKDKNQQQKEEENKDSKEEQNKDKQEQQKEDQKKQQEQKDKQQQEQEQKEKEQQQKEEQDKEQQEKDSKELPPSVKEKLKEMNMSEEKAKMILEAMKNQEVQYLQQNKRKGTKPKDKNKPDW